jgi:hypothetical protein
MTDHTAVQQEWEKIQKRIDLLLEQYEDNIVTPAQQPAPAPTKAPAPKVEVVRNDWDTWLSHRIRQVKDQRRDAQYMCSDRRCSQRDGIARWWYHQYRAEYHQRRTGHRVIEI